MKIHQFDVVIFLMKIYQFNEYVLTIVQWHNSESLTIGGESCMVIRYLFWVYFDDLLLSVVGGWLRKLRISPS